jgi:hypothetical protein
MGIRADKHPFTGFVDDDFIQEKNQSLHKVHSLDPSSESQKVIFKS